MIWPWRRRSEPDLKPAAPWMPLLETNPRRFADIAVHTPDRRKRFATYPSLQDALLGEALRLGSPLPGDRGADDQFVFVGAFYRALVVPRLDPPQRRAVYEIVRDSVEHQSQIGVLAFAPFMMGDPDPGIVASAVIDYAELYPDVAEDQLAGPRKVTELLTAPAMANRGAIFGGLLALGDPRVCALLRPYRDRITEEQAGVLAGCQTGFMSAATVEFLSEWLEDLNRTEAVDLFGVVAAALTRHVTDAKMPLVLTGIRPFPAFSITDEERRRLAAPIPLAEFAERIAPRMRALEREERPPRVMHRVLDAWGITPEPRSAPLREIIQAHHDWLADRGRVLVVWGVFSPEGPRLACVGVRERPNGFEAFHRALHFTGEEAWVLGPVDPDDDLVGVIADLVRMADRQARAMDARPLIDSIPSLVIWNDGQEPLARRLLLDAEAVRDADWGRELYYLEKYGDRLFERAGEALRVYAEALALTPNGETEEARGLLAYARRMHREPPAAGSWAVPPCARAPLTEAAFSRWWERMRGVEYRAKAFVAFTRAWVGAPRMRPERAARNEPGVMLEGMREFFDAYGMPFISHRISSDEIARDLGFDG